MQVAEKEIFGIELPNTVNLFENLTKEEENKNNNCQITEHKEFPEICSEQ